MPGTIYGTEKTPRTAVVAQGRRYVSADGFSCSSARLSVHTLLVDALMLGLHTVSYSVSLAGTLALSATHANGLLSSPGSCRTRL